MKNLRKLIIISLVVGKLATPSVVAQQDEWSQLRKTRQDDRMSKFRQEQQQRLQEQLRQEQDRKNQRRAQIDPQWEEFKKNKEEENKKWEQYEQESAKHSWNRQQSSSNQQQSVTMPKNLQEAFETLNISRKPTKQEIEKAYKRWALTWHPDKNLKNKVVAEENFKKIGAAYDLIKNDFEKRGQW